MSDDEDQNDVDISVIRKAIEISGNMIEQILKGIHYGSPEVRCLLYSECDYILECKVCRNLFRSLANFVAHKRVYCTLAFQQSDDYLNLVHPDEETVVVHPEMPDDTKQQKQKKSGSRSLESTVQQLKDGSLGHSAAYKLFSQAADKIEQQREAAKTQTLTFEPIPNTTKAMKVTVTPGVPEALEETMSLASEASESSIPSTSKLSPLQSSPTATLKSMLLKSALEGNTSGSLNAHQNSPEKVSIKQNPKSVLSPPKKMTLRCKEGMKGMPWKKGRSDSESPSPSAENKMDFNTLECLECNTAFRSKKTLIIHYQNAHCGKRTFFPCPLCESVFFYIFGLTRHLTKAHNKTKLQIDKMRAKLKKSSFVKEVTEQCLSAREQIQHVKNTTVTSTSIRVQTDPSKSDPGDIIQSTCFQTPSKEDHVCSNCGREFAKKMNLLNHRKICLTEGCTSVTNTVSKSVGSNVSSVNTVRKSPVFTSASQSSLNSGSKSASTPGTNTKSVTHIARKSPTVVVSKLSEDKTGRPSKTITDSKQLDNDDKKRSADSTSPSTDGKVMVERPEVKSEPTEIKRPLVKTTARNKTGCKFSRRVVSPPPPNLLPTGGSTTSSQATETSTDTQERKPLVKTTARSKKGFKPRVANPRMDIDQLVHSGITSSLDGSDNSDDETDVKPEIFLEIQNPASVVRKSVPNSEIKDETLHEFGSVKRKSNVVEEIWVDKLPGLPTEKVRSNRTYVVKSSTHQKLECQDTKRLREIVNETNLVCKHCSLEFSNVSNLRRHAIRHLGWKRYKCKMCKFSSYNKSECNTHLIRTHSNRFKNVSSINSLIVDLGKEGSRMRSRKKQQTLFERQAAECAEAGEDVYVTDTSYKRFNKKGKSEELKVSPPSKKRLRGEKGSDITPFNISTRNSPREFDIRPYKKLDPTTTLCTRKSSYPKKITINSKFHDDDDSHDEDADSRSSFSQSSQSSKLSRSDSSYYTASQSSARSKSDVAHVSDTDSEISVRSRNKSNVDSPQTRRSTRVGHDPSELRAARNLTPDLLN
ncbi:hypothetical protein LOTGIDRAFT_167533 [Lottia gigantea]|uniref:C2H2-type domain-containing protein n=1 Tax=Lottia gigantea TaxID=225164 RepID=V3Z5J3_LOTGI|nr:hypothetical protein LOTGIDRAFT_167533 [Lottia gigantea]ESO86028.1 hypothetical protein LOTGIDRAFT_167533 [Lottia gigantea]